MDENGWHNNVCQADECALLIYYVCKSDWGWSSYVFINDSATPPQLVAVNTFQSSYHISLAMYVYTSKINFKSSSNGK